MTNGKWEERGVHANITALNKGLWRIVLWKYLIGSFATTVPYGGDKSSAYLELSLHPHCGTPLNKMELWHTIKQGVVVPEAKLLHHILPYNISFSVSFYYKLDLNIPKFPMITSILNLSGHWICGRLIPKTVVLQLFAGLRCHFGKISWFWCFLPVLLQCHIISTDKIPTPSQGRQDNQHFLLRLHYSKTKMCLNTEMWSPPCHFPSGCCKILITKHLQDLKRHRETK